MMLLEARPVYALRDYIFAVEDQLDYQRLGGICARQPYSCYFCNVLRILRNLFGVGSRVVDVTYGFGSFYQACRREYHITAIDIVKREWLVEPDEFHECDATLCYKRLPREYFDVMVVDPPYATRPSPRTRSDERMSQLYHGRENYERIMRMVPTMAKHLVKKGGLVLVKGMDLQNKFEIDVKHNVYYWVYMYKQMGLTPTYILFYKFRASKITPTKRNPLVKNYSWLLVLRL